MEMMVLLVPMTLVITAVAIGFFLWAVDNGQYDDSERDADKALFDEQEDSTETTRGQHPERTHHGA
jgi:cbb3-type cytochrome oxidase maturation protein